MHGILSSASVGFIATGFLALVFLDRTRHGSFHRQFQLFPRVFHGLFELNFSDSRK